MNFQYFMPSRILFGYGSLEQLATVPLPGKKAMIITGGTSTTKLGYVARVQALLQQNNGVDSVVYDGVLPNPTKGNVEEAAAMIRQHGCDFVVGLGGGSSIDTAKSAALMATNDGDYWDYIGGGSGLGKPPANDPLPIVAITTTAGTGTEADPWTVVTKEETNEKIGFGYDKTFPTLSVVDPELMLTVPPMLTAYQGFDALFHATEGYIANIATPMSDMYALKSIELIGKFLARAVQDGNDRDAREAVALANTLSGFVESTSSCTSEHSLEHALSAYHPDLAHGAGLVMVSLAYYKFFAKVCPERLVDMAKALGKADATDPMDFVDALQALQVACGVGDLKMSDYQIDPDNFKMYAENAMDTMGGLFKLDRQTLTVEDVVGIYKDSYR